MATIEAGQRWRCSLGEQARIIIGRVEERGVHIHVTGLPDGGPIGHLPFTHEAIRASVTTLDGEAVTPPDGFWEGHAHWEQAGGGFFSAPLVEVLPKVLGIAMDAADAGLDELVAQMRRTRDERMIPAVYRRVLALPRWYFLGDPRDPGTPLRMVFDQRPDMPAVLVFTSRQKAIHCGVTRELADDQGQLHVRPAPVDEAVRWLVDRLRPSGVVYASINLEGLDFPVYLDQLESLWRDLGPGAGAP